MIDQSSAIINLDEYRPLKEIATFTLYEDHKGKPHLVLTSASEQWIERYEKLSERFERLGLMCLDGAAFLRRQARQWKKEGY